MVADRVNGNQLSGSKERIGKTSRMWSKNECDCGSCPGRASVSPILGCSTSTSNLHIEKATGQWCAYSKMTKHLRAGIFFSLGWTTFFFDPRASQSLQVSELPSLDLSSRVSGTLQPVTATYDDHQILAEWRDPAAQTLPLLRHHHPPRPRPRLRGLRQLPRPPAARTESKRPSRDTARKWLKDLLLTLQASNSCTHLAVLQL